MFQLNVHYEGCVHVLSYLDIFIIFIIFISFILYPLILTGVKKETLFYICFASFIFSFFYMILALSLHQTFFNKVLGGCSGLMVWLSEDSDEGCIVAEVECVVVGKMIDCFCLKKLGIADGNLIGSDDCCVDSCVG